VRDRRFHVQDLLGVIQQHEAAWITAIESVLHRLFPAEAQPITIYPILGYDMGIGLNGVVCMNCNHKAYLDEPAEFLFYTIHECVHVIYERHHRVPPLNEISSPAEWRSYYNTWVQNEGFAVYAPLGLRFEMGCLAERDYRVLFDPGQLEAHRLAFLAALEKLRREQPLTRDEYLETCFGAGRLTYRMGCEIIRRIERVEGLSGVQAAFYLDGDGFMQKFQPLVNDRG
jgi:hypothetical protein